MKENFVIIGLLAILVGVCSLIFGICTTDLLPIWGKVCLTSLVIMIVFGVLVGASE